MSGMNYRGVGSNETVSRVYETAGDRQTNRGRSASTRTRSYSIHQRQRSGSIVRVHGHENDGSILERSIGRWDRNGNYSGR